MLAPNPNLQISEEDEVPQPLVSCVMVTGKSPDRTPLARAALQSFLLQSYPNRELLVINTGAPLCAEAEAGSIREVFCPPERTLGELRNVGLQHARGEYVMQWDDDDFYHPLRIETQMKARWGPNCVLLRSQIRYSFRSNAAFQFNWKFTSVPGIPGSILHPNRAGIFYRPEPRAEDEHFIQDNFRGQVFVIENNHRDLSHLYLRFFHGANTWSEQHVMGHATPGRWAISPSARGYLREVLTQHYGRAITADISP